MAALSESPTFHAAAAELIAESAALIALVASLTAAEHSENVGNERLQVGILTLLAALCVVGAGTHTL
jgi:hypothetical protein